MLSLEVWFLFYRATCIYLNPQTEAKVKNLGFRILSIWGGVLFALWVSCADQEGEGRGVSPWNSKVASNHSFAVLSIHCTCK